MQAKQLTIRNLTPDLARRLRELSAARGESINTTVLNILRQTLDVDERRQRLARYATWSEADRREFDSALAAQRVIDAALWK
jgi:plasmid stability protein